MIATIFSVAVKFHASKTGDVRHLINCLDILHVASNATWSLPLLFSFGTGIGVGDRKYFLDNLQKL